MLDVLPACRQAGPPVMLIKGTKFYLKLNFNYKTVHLLGAVNGSYILTI